MSGLEQFKNQSYLSLETYRKTGAALQTPVWFVQDGDMFYVHTQARTGKVKRIRNNGSVRVAPCDQRGGIKGDWVVATASVVPEAGVERINKLMASKYGLMWTLFGWATKLRNIETVKLAIRP